MASSNGMLRTVDFLIRNHAQLDMPDRWGSTPLLEAVKGNHTILVELLKSRGATLQENMGVAMACEAAGEGDVELLGMLLRAGINPDIGA